MKNLSIFLILILLLGACGEPTTGDSENETSNLENDNSDEAVLEVYTTVYPLAYFTERIGGERVNVDSIYPPGANEHTFEPTQQDMISLADADLLFYIGLGLEGFIDSAQDTLSGENVELVATADSIPDEELETEASHEEESSDDHGNDEVDHEEEVHEEESHEGHEHDSTDPHVWISPVLSQKLAESIKDSLVKADSEGAEMYEANFEELVRELEQLDQSFDDLSNNVENKTFFVSHAAFGHIAETYGFEQVAVAGLNSQDEPSQKELTEIVNLAKEKNIDYVVFEQNISSKLTEIVQKEIGAEAVEMHNLGILTQEDIDNGETYFTLMEKNLHVLETVLK
jgi:zinc transport system substrate-binding protein